MKRFFLTLVAVVAMASTIAWGAEKKINYTDAQTLNHIGKMCKTTNPYHRVEVEAYPELTKKEASLLRTCAGEAIMFETDAKEIWVKAEFGYHYHSLSTPPTAAEGFNLYIQKDGEWLWAASAANKDGKDKKDGTPLINKPLKLIAHMSGEMHQCILYLPLFSELNSLEIGVPEGATIKPLKNPFRHNIAIFGSSFTHGASASCAGQTYPAFLQRQTGLNLCSFGMSGNSKLQRVMGEILGKTKADAYICDAFSNPTVEQIGERMRPFLNEIRKYNKKAPVIFLRTIYRERRNFDLSAEKREQGRIEFVEKLMEEICKEYKNVYFVNVDNQTGDDHMTSADGTHPYSWGYKRWADAIQPEIVSILAKHGIK